MRGVFFNSGLEFRLEVTGNDFHQGDTVPCVLTVKNHGDSGTELSDLKLQLAVGTLKKVKAKAADAFQILASADTASVTTIGPKSEQTVSWTVELDKNYPITDKNQSLYFLYGNSSDSSAVGQLLLTVALHPHIESIFSTLDTVFQFVPKGVTSKGSWSTAKLKPPSARKFSLVDELNLSCRFDNDALELKYNFTVKRFEGTTTVGVKKAKTEVEQRFDPTQYLFGGNFVHQEFVETSIKEAMSSVTTEL